MTQSTSIGSAVRRRRFYLPLALLAPTVGLLLIINLFPVLYQFLLSFEKYNLAFPQDARWTGVFNYVQLMRDTRLHDSIAMTLRFAVGAVAVELVLGMLVGSALSSSRFSKVAFPILIMPMVMPPIVVAYLFQYMYHDQYGLTNYLLRLLGIDIRFSFAAHASTVVPALIAVDVWSWTPFVALILWAGMASLSQDMLDAAKVDGASPWQLFSRVTLPLIMPQVLTAALFRFVDSLKLFVLVFAMTGGGPGLTTEAVSLYLYNVMFKFLEMGYGAAIGVALVVVTAVFAKLLLKTFGLGKAAG